MELESNREYSKRLTYLQDEYAEKDCDILSISGFIEALRLNFFTEDNGIGYFMDYNGLRLDHIICDSEWIITHRPDQAVFVAWAWHND